MDFARFVQLIETQTLWFARADQLEDPLEATFTDAELEYFRSQRPPEGVLGRSTLENFTRQSKFMRATTYVNSWRAGEGESLAMWDLYGKGSGIVAVKSSIGLLKNELASFGGPAFVAQVRYMDWRAISFSNNVLVLCARKDSSYEHESEVRAMIWEVASPNQPIFREQFPNANPWGARTVNDPPFGVSVSVNVGRMITEVIVGPRERPWVAELVRRLLSKYNLRSAIKVSDRLTARG
jgi:hypothetical protein